MFTPTQTDDYKVFGSEDFNVCMLENLILPPSVKIVLDNQELSPIKSGSFVYGTKDANGEIDVPNGTDAKIVLIRKRGIFLTEKNTPIKQKHSYSHI